MCKCSAEKDLRNFEQTSELPGGHALFRCMKATPNGFVMISFQDAMNVGLEIRESINNPSQ